jgi:hypothetical protein
MKRAHGVAPSISSKFLRRFLKPSIDKNKEWTDGVLSLVSPFALALCFAPIAACSCFSTAEIWPLSFRNSAMYVEGGVAPLVGCVDVSFS